MKPELKHARVITRIPRKEDNTIVDIERKSYHEELNSYEQQVEQSIKTSKPSLAADIMACLREITSGGTSELNLKIVTSKSTGEPERIVKTWTTKKEHYGR